MDSWIYALALITLPFDLAILVGGSYLIRAYAQEQALVREQLHDEQINHREELRYKTAMAKAGYEPQDGGSDFMGQLLAQGAQMLMQRGQQPAQPGQQETDNGKGKV